MVKKQYKNKTTHYTCEACGFTYKKKELAQQCENWCNTHKSCNVDLAKQAIVSK